MKFNLSTFLMHQVQYAPDNPAITFEGHSYSFRVLNERSNRWANAFKGLGLKKGERVGMLLPNRNEFLEVLFGLAKIGAVLVPLNSRLAPPELHHICKDCGIRSLIFDVDFNPTVEVMKSALDINDYVAVGSKPPSWAKDMEFIDRHASSEPELEVGGEDPAVILYTSGTIGAPKGVVRHHSSYLWVSTGFVSTLAFRRIIGLVVPLYYGWGLNFAITAVHRGDTTVLLKGFDAQRVLDVIREEKVDTFLAVGTMLQRMIQVPEFEAYLSSLRTLETTEMLPPQLRDKYVRLGIIIRRTYGLAETGFVTVATGSDLLKKPDSEGVPLFCSKVRIVSEEDVELPIGGVGEIVVQSPSVMKEYWSNPGATQKAIRNGWFHTGDLGRLDEHGRLYLAGREKDVIRSGGELISPADVEKVLHQNPNILDAAVIGRPDPVWGEKVCAVIRPREGALMTVEEVSAFCQERLARFEIPREVILTQEALPRDPLSGKLLRNVLRDRLNLKSST